MRSATRIRDEVIVVILGGGRGTRLAPLTRLRSKPAVPLAGKYRLIDLPISNSLHSGMERIFILTQYNSVSLHRHIVSTYKFDPFSGGFVEILAAQQTPSDETWFQGTADAVRQNLRFISELRGELSLILSGDHIYRMDYGLMCDSQREHDADVVVGVLPCSEEEIAGFGAVRVDAEGRIVEFREKPKTEKDREGMKLPPALAARWGASPEKPYLASMGIYLFRQGVLEECLATGAVDFGKDVLPPEVRRRRVFAHFFDGYWRDIGTIGAFYEAHMDLLRPDPPFDFYDPRWVIYTHPRYLPGTRMDGVRIDRSVIADGVNLRGATIRSSIIGVRSEIRGAEVRDSLIMGVDEDYPDAPPGSPPVGIGEGAVVRKAIVDKNARIGRDVRIVNEEGRCEHDGDGWVIRDGVVVVPKNSRIPDGTVI
jgi:glucose-1-phosphate adenylyltransferase